MTRISVLEARQQLTSLAKRVAAGEDIIVTHRGKDVLRLAPPTPPLPELTEFRASLQQLNSDEQTFSELAEAMREDRLNAPQEDGA